MIIYQSNVNQFKKDALNDINALKGMIMKNMLYKFGIRVANNEMNSWATSLPNVAKHIDNIPGDAREVLIEFNIPTSRRRVDFILLGKDKNGMPSAWLVELKQWSDVKEEGWNQFRVGQYVDSHPSDQARDYKFAIEHKLGLENKVNIVACAYLHNLKNKNSDLFSKHYQDILKQVSLYYTKNENEFSNRLNDHTKYGNAEQAIEYFKSAKWVPTKRFIELVAEDLNSKDMELYGSQRRIYESIIHKMKSTQHQKKMTFLISGDPGSGKTIVAFKLLNYITSEPNLNFKIQLMIPGQEVRDAFEHQFRNKILSTHISGSQMRNDYKAAIIDEGHKAIGRNTGLVNYRRLYQDLEFAIILIDDDQVINRKGITKSQVKEIAIKNGHCVEEYTISENFRNKGETALLDWIDSVIYKRNIVGNNIKMYKQEKYVNANCEYKLKGYNDDKSFVEAYYDKFKNNNSTRIVSLWHQEFYNGPANEKGDVKKTVPIGSYKFAWNPNGEWFNKISPKYKKTYSNDVKKFASIQRNFLTNLKNKDYIAYFNHIQGYEFDNIFVYIPNIFTYRNNEFVFHRDRLAKEVKISQTWSPKSKSKELDGRDPLMLNKTYFLNRIKVMLTRGTKSTHVYAEDEELNNYLRSTIID